MAETTYVPDPKYTVTTDIATGRSHSHDTDDLEDPFARITTTVVLDWKDALRQLLRRRKITVTVVTNIDGDRDALLHVMNIRPVKVVDAPAGTTPVGGVSDNRRFPA